MHQFNTLRASLLLLGWSAACATNQRTNGALDLLPRTAPLAQTALVRTVNTPQLAASSWVQPEKARAEQQLTLPVRFKSPPVVTIPTNTTGSNTTNSTTSTHSKPLATSTSAMLMSVNARRSDRDPEAGWGPTRPQASAAVPMQQ